MESRTFCSKICRVLLLNLFPCRGHLRLRHKAMAGTQAVEHSQELPYEKNCRSPSRQFISLLHCLLKFKFFPVSNEQRNARNKRLLYSNPKFRSLYLANESKFISTTRPKSLFDTNLENKTCSSILQGEGHY